MIGDVATVDFGSVNEANGGTMAADERALNGGDLSSMGNTTVTDDDGVYNVKHVEAEKGNEIIKKMADYHVKKAAEYEGKEVLGLYDAKGNPRKWSFVVGGNHEALFKDLPWYKRWTLLKFTGDSYVMHNHPTTAVGSRGVFLTSKGFTLNSATDMFSGVLGAYMVHTNPNATIKNSVYHQYVDPKTGLFKQAYVKW